MKRFIGLASVGLLLATLLAVSGAATDAQMYFSSDKNGQHRVTNVQEGDEIWIVVVDNDENIDCDIRDKMWPDVKIMDPKTGAYIVWDLGQGEEDLALDYLEETGADTGVFVSKRAFQIGTRLEFTSGAPWRYTHVVDVPVNNAVDDFQWGHYLYADGGATDYADDRGWFGDGGDGTDPSFNIGLMGGALHPERPDVPLAQVNGGLYLIGRFENMDTLIGMYQDPNDATDVAVGLMKIIDTEATISWSQEIYKDGNQTAEITVIDPDENLNCNEVEYVPVFIIVNPGSWNPEDGTGDDGGVSPTNFCMLKRSGGVDGTNGVVGDEPIRWYNIYNADANAADPINNGAEDGRYYIDYPALGEDNVSEFDTVDPTGITPVSFYAQETGVNTGVFQLNLNSILDDLEFNSLRVRDVLVVYYLDPNDFDDFKLATAYIEAKQHSVTSFTDADRSEKDTFWIGRDPVYLQVIDANANVDPCCPEQILVHVCDPHGEDDSEWLFLDESSSNSPVFITFSGTELLPVWDALGVGLADSLGGYHLQLDNWKLEVFNEDEVYARYNDVYYGVPRNDVIGVGNLVDRFAEYIGDINIRTQFPPFISSFLFRNDVANAVGPRAIQPGARVANDVSFDMMSIADTQVYDGGSTNMWFLDRQGNRVSGYVNSDCVFIEVLDPDQDEDQYRRERIDGWWDEGQNVPFGPETNREFECDLDPQAVHTVNPLLGDTNIFNDGPPTAPNTVFHSQPKVYVLNPRSGFWAAVDLLENGTSTGDFVSVICIDLVSAYECVPSLRALPGDTIVAFYQDPSNHSDTAMISIKVGVGGAGTPPSQQSTTMFVDAVGNEVVNYTDAELVYVKVIDPSHAGESMLSGGLQIEGDSIDLLPLAGASNDTFITEGLSLGCHAGDEITATYTDPRDMTDVSSDTVSIIASELAVDSFYVAPNPIEDEATFGFNGSGVPTRMSVDVYDLSGGLIWSEELAGVSEIVWEATGVANGAYIYVIYTTDGTTSFSDIGKLFVNR